MYVFSTQMLPPYSLRSEINVQGLFNIINWFKLYSFSLVWVEVTLLSPIELNQERTDEKTKPYLQE